MTPTEKREELIEKYMEITFNWYSTDFGKADAIKCAIIDVTGKIDLPVGWADVQLHKKEPEMWPIESTEEFWEEVLKELKAIR